MSLSYPAWYKQYTIGFSIIRLTAIVLRHAEDLAVAARQVRDMEEAERQREVLQFEEMTIDDTKDDTERDNDSVASDASFLAKLNSGSSRVFGTPCLRLTQQIAIHQLLVNPSSSGKLIVVDRTGGGRASSHSCPLSPSRAYRCSSSPFSPLPPINCPVLKKLCPNMESSLLTTSMISAPRILTHRSSQ